MARIPDSTQLGYSVPRTRTPRFQDRSGEIVADATQGFARTLGQATESLQEHDDQFNYARAKSTLLAADVEARRELENDPDWETYEKRYTERMAKAREQATGMIRGGRSRSLFDMDAKLDVERGVGEVRGIARRKEVDVGRAGLAGMLDSNRTSALESQDEATRVSILSAVQDGLSGAVQKGYISEQERVSQSRAWAESYAEGFIDTLDYSRQVETLSKPEGTPAALLPPDRRANLLRTAENQLRIERDRAEAEKKASMVEMRQSLNDQLKDGFVAAQHGLPVSVPSKAVLQSAFGQAEGAQRYELAVKSAQLSGDVASLQQLPNDEIIARVQSYEPTQQAGAAEQAQMQGYLATSAGEILKARAADPAGYLVQHAPKSQQAWSTFQQAGTEEARESYISAINADRERLGLPKGDILPNSYAKELAEEIANPKSAEDLASSMESEAQRWGDHWPDVHSQIAKDIPDMAAVIGSGIDRSAAVLLASTSKLKESELESMLPPSVKWEDVRDNVKATFDDVRRSFPAEGARTWQAIEDSAIRLSVSYMQAGANRSNAVERAYKALIGNQYTIGEVKDVPFLVPRQFDAGEVENEAQRLIDEFEPTVDMIVAPPGEDAARFTDRAREAIRDQAYWVARGDGLGLRMHVGSRPTSVTYTFEQLAAMSTKRRADAASEVKRLRDQALKARAPR